MDLIFRKRLYIPRADSFDDDFEGSYTKLADQISKGITITYDGHSTNKGLINDSKDALERAFVSCWTLKESENMSLWKLFGGKNSIAIETTVKALKHELDKNCQNDYTQYLTKTIVKVDYIDHKSSDETLATELMTSRLKPLTKKASAYSYEDEVRVILDHIGDNLDDLKEKLGAGVDLKVDTKELINKIYVSPEADNWFYNLVKSILNDLGMEEIMKWSNMRTTPKDEVFNE